MVKVSCDGCKKIYRVDPKKIQSDKARFTCRECGYINYLSKYVDNDPEEVTQDMVVEGMQLDHTPVKPVPVKSRLQVKINTVLIALIVIIMGAFTAYNYVTVKTNMETELKNDSSIVAERLSTYLVEAFWSLDDEILQQSLKSEMMEKNIYAINILDRDGRTVYMGYKRNADWEPIPSKNSVRGSYVSHRKVIEKDDDKLGAVAVYLTSRFVEKELEKTMLNIIVTAALLLVAVSLSAFMVVNKIVVNPIGKLTNLANEISMGNLEATIPKESNDEIGTLADSFERMRYSMVLYIKQLRKK